MSKPVEEPKKTLSAAAIARNAKQEAIDMFGRREVTFTDLLTLVRTDKLHPAVGRLRLYEVLGGIRGWSKVTAFSALSQNNINPELTLRTASRFTKNHLLLDVIRNEGMPLQNPTVRMDTAYPWRGSILEFLAQQDPATLPNSLKKACQTIIDARPEEVQFEPMLWDGVQPSAEHLRQEVLPRTQTQETSPEKPVEDDSYDSMLDDLFLDDDEFEEEPEDDTEEDVDDDDLDMLFGDF